MPWPSGSLPPPAGVTAQRKVPGASELPSGAGINSLKSIWLFFF